MFPLPLLVLWHPTGPAFGALRPVSHVRLPSGFNGESCRYQLVNGVCLFPDSGLSCGLTEASLPLSLRVHEYSSVCGVWLENILFYCSACQH
ncbi:hypothetical protein ACLKA6_018399 [Drosophila palustris]